MNVLVGNFPQYMKALFAIIVVLAVAVGAWFLLPQEATAPSAETGSGSNTETTTGSQATTGTGASVDTSLAVGSDTVVIEVGAGGFYFNPKEIRVKEGQTVQINVTNEGGTHDWVIDEFDARTPILQSGQKASVTFVADRKGTFEYYCSVGSHRANGMVGKLIVE